LDAFVLLLLLIATETNLILELRSVFFLVLSLVQKGMLLLTLTPEEFFVSRNVVFHEQTFIKTDNLFSRVFSYWYKNFNFVYEPICNNYIKTIFNNHVNNNERIDDVERYET